MIKLLGPLGILLLTSFYVVVLSQTKTYINIYSVKSEKSLDCSQGNITAEDIDLTSPGQQFEVLPSKVNGSYILRCVKSKKVIDLKGTCSKKGNYLHAYKQHGFQNQRFKFLPDARIKSDCPNLYIAVENGRAYAIPYKETDDRSYRFINIPVVV